MDKQVFTVEGAFLVGSCVLSAYRVLLAVDAEAAKALWADEVMLPGYTLVGDIEVIPGREVQL